MAAERATPEKIAFFVRHTSGLICAPITNERADELDLPLMVAQQHRVAAHRVHRHRRLPARHHDGHLGRGPGGHHPGADRPGHPARRPDPARPHPRAAGPGGRRAQAGRPHRGGGRPGPHGRAVPRRRALRGGHRGRAGDGPAPGARALRGPPRPACSSPSPTSSATGARPRSWSGGWPRPGCRPSAASSRCYRLPERHRPRDPPGLRHGRAAQGEDNVLVRVHSECLTGDVFGSLRCDCGAQLQAAMRLIAEAGLGVVVYLRGHEGRGIGIAHKLQAYKLQDGGLRHRRRQPGARACRSTAGSTASAPRSSSTWASPPCGS